VSRREDTIFALSSGAPPAAIAIVRVSGAAAGPTLQALSGGLPSERRASMRTLRDDRGDVLDRALVLWTPGPHTATGEDIAELHLHGGRAVVSAVLATLAGRPAVRHAEPGEFTRRAFASGRIDLNEAEGLADLLTAETEAQRRNALQHVGGAFGRMVAGWRDRLLALAAQVEARIEYGEEDALALADVELPRAAIAALATGIDEALRSPPAERLRDGVRVVIAGPPNAGKSTLLNALAERDVAIVSEVPGTTRDVVEAPVIIGGMPFLLSDTAGIRGTAEPIEQEGIRRARLSCEAADIVLWLGESASAPANASVVRPKADLTGQASDGEMLVSAVTGFGMTALRDMLLHAAGALLPKPDEIALNVRQRGELAIVSGALHEAGAADDELIVADHLQHALAALDRASGASSTEDMLDALFGSFCLGK